MLRVVMMTKMARQVNEYDFLAKLNRMIIYGKLPVIFHG